MHTMAQKSYSWWQFGTSLTNQNLDNNRPFHHPHLSSAIQFYLSDSITRESGWHFALTRLRAQGHGGRRSRSATFSCGKTENGVDPWVVNMMTRSRLSRIDWTDILLRCRNRYGQNRQRSKTRRSFFGDDLVPNLQKVMTNSQTKNGSALSKTRTPRYQSICLPFSPHFKFFFPNSTSLYM